MTDEEMRAKVIAHDATLSQMNERLGDIRAWLMALTAIQAAPIGGIVAILLRQ
jgi:hypothetical protein